MMNMTASEAAKRFDVSIQTIYRHIKSGKLNGFQKDGKWYVQLDEHDEQETQQFEPPDEHFEQFVEHPSIQLLKDENSHLRELLARRDKEIESFMQQIDHLTQVVAMSQKNVASLTEQNQLLLEDKSKQPFWKRWFYRQSE